jgi:hypothetical protein
MSQKINLIPFLEKIASRLCFCYIRNWRGNPRERSHMEDPGVVERIILQWILKKWYG